jgi:hypothetical protein
MLSQAFVNNISEARPVSHIRTHGHDLNDVDFTLFNEVSQTRGILTESFRNVGFRPLKNNILGTHDKLRAAVARGEMDFLVLEADERPEVMCEFIRDIRHGRIGPNPYLVISIVTWRPDGRMIKQFIDAGTDDVIVLPASTHFASGRVDHLIDHRRDFVVTTKYVGPDRRVDRPGAAKDELGTIQVPNGLRYKATGDESAKPNGAHLKHVNQLVETHRLRRVTLRLEQLAAQAERFAVSHRGLPLPDTPLGEMLDLIEEIEARGGGQSRVDVGELIGSLGDIREAILTADGANADLFALLKVHAQSLLAVQRGDKKASEFVLRAVRTAKNVVEKRGRDRS